MLIAVQNAQADPWALHGSACHDLPRMATATWRSGTPSIRAASRGPVPGVDARHRGAPPGNQPANPRASTVVRSVEEARAVGEQIGYGAD
jgi:hypothetical protein